MDSMDLSLDAQLNEPMPTKEDINLCLKYAIGILEEQGWCQYTSCDGDRVCAGMAITMASIKICEPQRWVLSSRLNNATDALLKMKLGINSVIKWNDTKGRTKDEVINAFEEALS